MRLAVRQQGVVDSAQLRRAGFDRAMVKRWLRAGRLRRLHRGVFQVAAAGATPRAAEMAALLACGHSGSVISHRSAAQLWGLTVDRPETRVDVTVAGRNPGRKPGIVIHRVAALDRRDVRKVDGVPTTAPARTLLDLAAVLSFDDLEAAYAETRGRGLVRHRDFPALLARNRGRRGAKALRRLLDFERDHGISRSQAERRFLALARAAGLLAPKVNTRVGGFEVDFMWPEQRVIVEVDGFAFHGDRVAFERDRERDASLAALGCVVMRVTWQQLVGRREAVIARVASALAVRT
ncbi:MAG: type IV toxin-antitoxin system AbiEi family antitoxin domain-containing protein [Pseudomonadales bacterium]